MNLKIRKLKENATIPTYGSSNAAGADLYACLDAPVVIAEHQTVAIHTGISMEIPEGYVGLIFARSGLATKRGLAPANKVGVVDSDYRGKIIVALHNHGTEEQTIYNNDRVAQIAIMPYVQCEFILSDELSDTKRGSGGFGSTGI